MFPLNVVAAAGDFGQFQIVAGDVSGGTFIGYSLAYATPAGSIAPDDQLVTPGNGVLQIRACYTIFAQFDIRSTDSFPNNDNSFTQIRVRGTFDNGAEDVILDRSLAVYTASESGESRWRWGQPEGWPNASDMIVGNKYALDFDP